jgi:hypothetical protein
MSIRADPFMVMDRKQHAEEHARLANILENAKLAEGASKRKKEESEAMKAMKMPKARMETVERPGKMKQHADGAPLMHMEY